MYHTTNLDQVSCWHLLMCRCQPVCLMSWWFNTRFFLVHQTIKCWCQLCTYITCLLLSPQIFLIDILPLLSLHLTWVSEYPNFQMKTSMILVWSTLNLLGLAIFPLRQETFRSCSNWVWEPQIWGNSQVAPEQFILSIPWQDYLRLSSGPTVELDPQNSRQNENKWQFQVANKFSMSFPWLPWLFSGKLFPIPSCFHRVRCSVPLRWRKCVKARGASQQRLLDFRSDFDLSQFQETFSWFFWVPSGKLT